MAKNRTQHSGNSSLATKKFPPKGPDNPLGIEYGDMIEYGANNVTVMIYACGYYTLGNGSSGHIVDGNVCCNMDQVTRIVHKFALQSL